MRGRGIPAAATSEKKGIGEALAACCLCEMVSWLLVEELKKGEEYLLRSSKSCTVVAVAMKRIEKVDQNSEIV